MTSPNPHHDRDLIQRRQRARAIVLALLLGAFVVLIFFITIAKIRQGEGAPSASATTVNVS